MKVLLFRFLRSPLGLGLWGLCAFLVAASVAGGLLPLLAAVPLFGAAGAIATLALLLSPAGARSVVAERDRDRSERDARVLGGVAAARKRLALLRLKDASVKEAVDRLVSAAGGYLEAAVRRDSRDPVIEDAVLGAVEAVDDYLRLADAKGGGADIAARTVRVLAGASEEIERRVRDSYAAADRMAAREDLP